MCQSYESPGQLAGKMKDLARALSTAVTSCFCIHAVLIAPDGGIRIWGLGLFRLRLGLGIYEA